MGLLSEVQLALPLPRLAQLTNADLPNNPATLAVAGTCAVANGSPNVFGTGTSFLSQAVVGNVIAFSSQPNVNYTVAGIADDTHLTLAVAFTGATAAAATALTAGINYQTLQIACNYAVVEFVAATNLPWDDVTATNIAAVPPVINKCIWTGVALVLAWLYQFRGFPDEQTKGAFEAAEKRLRYVLHTWGDGAWSPPQSDSVFAPTIGPTRAPVFDVARFGTIVPQAPGWGSGGGNGWGTGVPNEYGG